MKRVTVIADIDKLRNPSEVYLTGSIVVQIIEMLHRHKREDDHAKREGIWGPAALVMMIRNLKRVDLLRRQVDATNSGILIDDF